MTSDLLRHLRYDLITTSDFFFHLVVSFFCICIFASVVITHEPLMFKSLSMFCTVSCIVCNILYIVH